MSTGPDVEEVQAEAEEVACWREGQTLGGSDVQGGRMLMPRIRLSPHWCRCPRDSVAMLAFLLANLHVMVGGPCEVT